MNFARCAMLAGCVALHLPFQLTAVAPRLGPAPHTAPRNVVNPSASPPAESSSASTPAKPPQAYKLPPDKLAKAIALGRIRNIVDLAGSLLDLAVLWLLLATRASAAIESWSQRITPRRWLQGLFFFAIFLLITALADLPLDVYAHHVSRSYGISVAGWGDWLLDLSKGLGLSILFVPPILLAFNWIVRRWPRRYWLYSWMATIPLMVVSVFIAPLFEPIFNRYEPLAKNHPVLVGELQKVVARTGTSIPPERMFLMKAAQKTNGLNAYVSGLGSTKRIVVWDTTADRIPDDQVLFLLGHETGHYVLNHIAKGLALSAVALFFVYWGCARFAAWLARGFGVRWGLAQEGITLRSVAVLSSRSGFVVLLFTISVAGFVLAPIDNLVSRYFEHQADVYGQEAIHGIVTDPQKTAVAAFNALGEAWLEDPNPSPFLECWTYSHPSTQSRANFAAQYDPWANGGHGEFFDK
jgi:Zn-dependent protease with chaperone function